MPESFDLGFLGGGQLARMSIQAAQRMGLRCVSLDPGSDTPASQIATSLVGALDDADCIRRIADRCDRLTLENEFIPAMAIRGAQTESQMVPNIEALATIQDKLLQRQAFERAGVPSPLAVPIEADASAAIACLGFPMVLKARFGGYDGKGTRYARTPEELESHRRLWGAGGWLAESFVPFRRELATMVFVGADGASGCFPTMETVQVNHVCDLVYLAGRDVSEIAIAAVRAVEGQGLFGVEMFELDDGSVQVNEIAPRPHNSGHYTLDWGGVSQFEQHVRLAMGHPAAVPEGRDTCMANLLGQEGVGDFRDGLRAALDVEPEARIHWYGKAESRPGRKMGHLNVVGDDCVERAKLARVAFYNGWTGR